MYAKTYFEILLKVALSTTTLTLTLLSIHLYKDKYIFAELNTNLKCDLWLKLHFKNKFEDKRRHVTMAKLNYTCQMMSEAMELLFPQR